MKINRNNKDLKIINWNSGYNCGSCVFKHQPGVYYCNLFCRPIKYGLKIHLIQIFLEYENIFSK